MAQLPPQGLDIAVPAVHLAEQRPHGGQGLGFALIPNQLLPVPAGAVEHAVRAMSAVSLQDLPAQNGDLFGRIDHQLAPVAGDAVQLDHNVLTDGQILTLVQI